MKVVKPSPKYEELAAHFRAAIQQGKLSSGDKLPSVSQMSRQFQCSGGTICRALLTLENEGLVLPRQGAGVFVRERKPRTIIGVVVHNMRNHDHAHLVNHISAAAERSGHAVMLCVPYAVADDPDREVRHRRGVKTETEFIDRIAELGCAGIIKCPTTLESEQALRDRMRALGIPFVIVNDYWSDCHDTHHVLCDRRASIEVALNHLAGLGRRRIGLQMDAYNHDPSAARAFETMVRARGLEGEILGQGPAETIAAIRDRRLSAVVSLFYGFACDLIGHLRAAGLRVPEDVSVMSLGDAPDDWSRFPNVTTIEPPMAEIADGALRLLFQGAHAPVVHLRFPPTLHVGETSGPCRAGHAAQAAAPV